MKFGGTVCFIFICLVAVFAGVLLPACGKKGEPTLVSFFKPAPVMKISVLHREDALLLSWSYSVSSEMQDMIKGFSLEKAVGSPANNTPVFKKVVFLPVSKTRYTDKDFTPGKVYFYRIRVLSARDIVSDQSPAIKVVPAVLPPPPDGLSSEVKNDSVEIRWAKVPGKVKYNIYKSHEKNVSAGELLNKTALSEPFYSDKVDTRLPSYYFVRSLLDSEIKDEGFPSEVLEVDPSSFVPSKPSALTYVYVPQGLVLLWNANPESWVKGYRVYRKRDKGGFGLIGETTTPTFKDKEPLTAGTVYRITALGPSRESEASEPLEVNPPQEGG